MEKRSPKRQDLQNVDKERGWFLNLAEYHSYDDFYLCSISYAFEKREPKCERQKKEKEEEAKHRTF